MPEVKNCLTCKWEPAYGIGPFLLLDPHEAPPNTCKSSRGFERLPSAMAVERKTVVLFNGAPCLRSDEGYLPIISCPAHEPKDPAP